MERTLATLQLVHSHDINLFSFADCNLPYIILQLSFWHIAYTVLGNKQCVRGRACKEGRGWITIEVEYRSEIFFFSLCFYSFVRKQPV